MAQKKKAKKVEKEKVGDYLDLLKKTKETAKKLDALLDEVKKKASKLPSLHLQNVDLKICVDENVDPDEIGDEKIDEVVGLQADCTFISKKEIMEKVYPYLHEHFPPEKPKKSK